VDSQASALVPLEVRMVEFYGDQVTGALVQEGGEPQIYVPLRPICDYLGLAWSGQYERVKRDEVLADALRGVRVKRTAGHGGTQELVSLPLEYLPGWLFGVNASRVRPQLKERIILYKRECYRALWNAFKHDILPSTELALQTRERSGAEVAYEIATAVQHLARQQMQMEQRLDGRIDKMAHWAQSVQERLAESDQRLSALEIQVSPQAIVTEQQAAEIALAVKNVGHALASRGIKPGYSQVYGELYRRYGISSYKNLARGDFDRVITWLRDWYQAILAEDSEAPAS
jgi:hypothetical protein